MGLVAIPKKPTIVLNQNNVEVHLYTLDTNKFNFELYNAGSVDCIFISDEFVFTSFQELENKIAEAVTYATNG